MFWRKKTDQKSEKVYDLNQWKPVVRCSICTGEQVAGFKSLETGKFEEVMLIRGERDMDIFKEKFGVTTVTKEY